MTNKDKLSMKLEHNEKELQNLVQKRDNLNNLIAQLEKKIFNQKVELQRYEQGYRKVQELEVLQGQSEKTES